MYYVYALIDPRTDLPFYIGKGKKKRSSAHLFPSSSDQNKYKDNIIAKIQSLGLAVGIANLYENVEDENEAYRLEAETIETLGRRNIDPDGILTNICIDQRPPRNEGRDAYQYDHTIRTFIHVDGQKFVGTRDDFHKHTGITRPNVYSLLTNRFKSYKGWVIEGSGNTAYIRKGERANRRDTRIFTFHHHDGRVFSGTQYDFCLSHTEISKPEINNLISGKKSFIKGWYMKGTDVDSLDIDSSGNYKPKTGINSPVSDKTVYLFVNDNGEEFEGDRFEFSNYSGIDSKRLSAMICGNVKTIGDWHLSGIDTKRLNNTRKYCSFVNISGERFSGVQRDFCEKYNYEASSVSKLILGKVAQMKGWRIEGEPIVVPSSNEGKRNKNVYVFQNEKGNQFTGTPYDFRMYSKMSSANVSRLTSGARNQAGGWKIIKEEKVTQRT
jgi:hypothetical protein